MVTKPQIRFFQIDEKGNLKNLLQPEGEIFYVYIPRWGKILKFVYDESIRDYHMESEI